MINGYAPQGDNRDKRDEYSASSYQVQAASSPPATASPFAFAPPPLSAVPTSTRPSAMSEQTTSPDYNYYPRSGPSPTNGPGAGAAYPYPYRSISGDTRAPPPAPLNRAPSFPTVLGSAGISSQPSPTTSSPYYMGRAYASAQHSPRGTSLYAQQSYYPPSPYTPTAQDMPRSLSYPNSYGGYPSGYLPSLSSPALVHAEGPPLIRHNSVNGISTGPAMGYAFASRVPLVERPFKCDQCVQSFNRNHDLKRHKRIHLSVKPFGCEKCGKTFSRKDALRRHWMVRGCRGEEGATAPITPSYPLNNPPALSPSSPPTSAKGEKDVKPDNNSYSNPMSFAHPQAPPPLTSLPTRQSSDPASQIILTPVDPAGRSGPNSGDDSAVIDPALSSLDSGRPNSTNDTGDYFDVMRNKDLPDSANSSFSRFASSPKDVRHHPYSRPLPSPHGGPLGYTATHLLPPIAGDDMNKDGGWNRPPSYYPTAQ